MLNRFYFDTFEEAGRLLASEAGGRLSTLETQVGNRLSEEALRIKMAAIQ